MSVAIGIDIGGSSVKAAAVVDGKIVWTGKSSHYARPDKSMLIAAIRDALKNRPATKDWGLCVPGLLDRATRTITLAVNVPGLSGQQLDSLLADSIGADYMVRAAITNDAFASALDICAQKKLHGRTLVLALGTGIGAAVLDDGKFLLVEGESPGHLGQMDVSLDAQPPLGPDGSPGTLEAYLGAPALKARYGENYSSLLPMLGIDQPPLRALVHALRIAHAMYRPHHVVLCGGIGIRLGDRLVEIQKLVNDKLTTIVRPDWTLGIGSSDYHAAAGAARLALTEAAQ